MPDEFVIKQESFPKRCEVCHQVDLFNPKTNHCTRCRQISRKVRRTALASNKKPEVSTYRGLVWVFAMGGASLFGIFVYGEIYPPSLGLCNGGGLIAIPMLILWFLLFMLAFVVFVSYARSRPKR